MRTAADVRLLLVEDDPDDVQAIQRVLPDRPLRYELQHCDRLRPAIEHLGQSRYSAVLLDLRLPDAFGLEGLRELQRVAPDVPIIVCSGLNDHDLALQAVQAGAQDYLTKEHLDKELLGRSISYAIERKRTETYIQQLAYVDNLTGLPNRLLLFDRMAQAIAHGARNNHLIGVLYIDVDNFKHINDSRGHAQGDEVLKSTAKLLTSCVRKTDTVSRLGGDEFVVVMSEIGAQSDAALAAQKILEAFRQPIPVGGRQEEIRLSIGIAVWPDDGNSTEKLLRSADSAMYAAKRNGGTAFEFHSRALSVAAVRRTELTDAMSRALDNGEFRMHYQPIVELSSGDATCFEALVRWRTADAGLRMPGEFVPVAEKGRLIGRLGDWTIRETCRQKKAWSDAGLPAFTVALNISPYHLMSSDVPATILECLELHGLAPEELRVEITESGVMVNEERGVLGLQRLVAAGIQVSLDDFGTGYASLAHLKEFPVDTIKIDRSFVADLQCDGQGLEMIKGVISLGHALGKRVVAEGVENAMQLDLLESLGCDAIQGYYFSRPVPAREVHRMFRTGDGTGSLRGRGQFDSEERPAPGWGIRGGPSGDSA